ncbi:hypothetical protein L837_2924 [Mycobacterium avium MAV_061107_1842]|nr:hypothetical protein L837_2924 [Mycobacterium avium MAV_061107_1842]
MARDTVGPCILGHRRAGSFVVLGRAPLATNLLGRTAASPLVVGRPGGYFEFASAPSG